MAKLEEWIVGFVFAELVALALVIVLSCWCCRRSTRRAREDEATQALPMTLVTRPKAASRAAQSSGGSSSAASGSTAADRQGDSDDSHDDDGLVSGGLWGFVAGYPSTHEPRRSKKDTKTARAGDGKDGVEVVNISVNTAVAIDEDEEKEDKAAVIDKSGSAA